MDDGRHRLRPRQPDPEVDPRGRREHAAVVATGRCDYPNQINNVLAFPGFFRGMLDAGAAEITDEMMLAAADAIADCVAGDELNTSYIVPQRLRPARRAGGRRRGPRRRDPAGQRLAGGRRGRPRARTPFPRTSRTAPWKE